MQAHQTPGPRGRPSGHTVGSQGVTPTAAAAAGTGPTAAVTLPITALAHQAAGGAGAAHTSFWEGRGARADRLSKAQGVRGRGHPTPTAAMTMTVASGRSCTPITIVRVTVIAVVTVITDEHRGGEGGGGRRNNQRESGRPSAMKGRATAAPCPLLQYRRGVGAHTHTCNETYSYSADDRRGFAAAAGADAPAGPRDTTGPPAYPTTSRKGPEVTGPDVAYRELVLPRRALRPAACR